MKYIIVDGNNLAYRAEAVLDLSVDGESVSAVYGSLVAIRYTLSQLGPAKVIVAWDRGRSEYRTKLFPDYKKHRVSDDPEQIARKERVVVEIKLLQKLLACLGIVQIEIPGVEADDIIAVLCHSLEGSKIVVSNDNDFCQLVRQDVSFYMPTSRKEVTLENYAQLFGLEKPRQHLHCKVLLGDKSDNIPGVDGVGKKTAPKIVRITGSSLWTDIQAHVKELSQDRYTKRVLDKKNKDIIERNRLLMDLGEKHLMKHRPELWDKVLPCIPPKSAWPLPNVSEFERLLVKYKFASILRQELQWIEPFRRYK